MRAEQKLLKVPDCSPGFKRTRKISSLIIGIVLMAVTVNGAELAPAFSDYAVTIFNGKVAEVDLSSDPMARRFRTMLRWQTAKGANFAGHYRVATWGCGTECMQFAFVDCKTGRVYFPKDMPYVTWNRYPGKDPGLHFRVDSRLFILKGSQIDGPDKGIFYYEWKNDRLTLIRRVLVQSVE
jgi:hypothetical protein